MPSNPSVFVSQNRLMPRHSAMAPDIAYGLDRDDLSHRVDEKGAPPFLILESDGIPIRSELIPFPEPHSEWEDMPIRSKPIPPSKPDPQPDGPVRSDPLPPPHPEFETVVFTGDWRGNMIAGGSNDDVLKGKGGDDLIDGVGGNDRIDGGAGDDILNGGDGDDVINGGAGDDRIDGGAGADTMSGGWGNDIYTVDSAGDVVKEKSDGGMDMIHSDVSYVLVSGVEYLVLRGRENIDGTGNAGDNDIRGNAGDNALSGGRGNDILFSGGGDDILSGGAGRDTFVFTNAGPDNGASVVTDFLVSRDTLFIAGREITRDADQSELEQNGISVGETESGDLVFSYGLAGNGNVTLANVSQDEFWI